MKALVQPCFPIFDSTIHLKIDKTSFRETVTCAFVTKDNQGAAAFVLSLYPPLSACF